LKNKGDDAIATHVLGDWGTSHLRLYLMEGARIRAEREGPGIGGLTRPPAGVLQELLANWESEYSLLDVTLCGMASSRNGLQELAYAAAPADAAGWAQSAREMQIGAVRVLIANGLKYQDEAGGFDVMRGEETQVFGAVHIDSALRDGNHCVVLPGTHSKWVALESGSIRSFRTAMTGELYALLSRDSTLLKAANEAGEASHSDDGFAAGSADGLQLRTSLLSALFKTRTAQLLEGRSHAWASGYLSGLLIGYEVASMAGALAHEAAITIIGRSQLTELYRQVFAARGMTVNALDGADCARSGLSELRDLWLERGS
jgi:2-dehydro-3-deoxygalactonokinase